MSKSGRAKAKKRGRGHRLMASPLNPSSRDSLIPGHGAETHLVCKLKTQKFLDKRVHTGGPAAESGY